MKPMSWPVAAVLQVKTELMEKLSIITEVRSSFSVTGSPLYSTANLLATHRASQRERFYTRAFTTALREGGRERERERK